MTLNQQKERVQAIQFYKAIVAGKVEGFKILQTKKIKVGSITFIIP